jgi:hypothetical protein
VRSLAEADLIDEYHFLMYPVIVEVGELLFDGIETRTDLNLKSVTTLSEGGVVVAYASVESMENRACPIRLPPTSSTASPGSGPRSPKCGSGELKRLTNAQLGRRNASASRGRPRWCPHRAASSVAAMLAA